MKKEEEEEELKQNLSIDHWAAQSQMSHLIIDRYNIICGKIQLINCRDFTLFIFRKCLKWQINKKNENSWRPYP